MKKIFFNFSFLCLLFFGVYAVCPANEVSDEFAQAVKSGKFEKVQSFIDYKVNVNDSTITHMGIKFPVLNWCLWKKKYKMAAILTEGGADVNARDGFGRTPIIVACEYGAPEYILNLLIKKDADVNAIQTSAYQYGYTALIWAALRHDLKSVNILLDAGADANAKNKHHKSAMDYAKANKDHEMYQVLRFASGY